MRARCISDADRLTPRSQGEGFVVGPAWEVCQAIWTQDGRGPCQSQPRRGDTRLDEGEVGREGDEIIAVQQDGPDIEVGYRITGTSISCP